MRDRRWVYAGLPVAIAFGVAFFAAWYHGIGHVSMDSSMQLYEAMLGESVTWNPPSMSAILRWMGSGPVGSTRLVWFNAFATYLSLAVVAALLFCGGMRTEVRSPARLLAVCLILLNPVLFLYVGIVWKDVLFASLMLAGAATGILAMAAKSERQIWCFALISAAALAIGMKIRQHGIFMAPVLLAVPVLAVAFDRKLGWRRAVMNSLLVLVMFAGSALLMRFAVAQTIHTPPEMGDSVGYRGLMMYDIAGILTYSKTPTDDLPLAIPQDIRDIARNVYSPDRGDFLNRSPDLLHWLSSSGDVVLKERWTALVKAEPAAFGRHKLAAWGAVLDINGVRACLPLHVGIDGNHEYLRQAGFEPGTDLHDRTIYGHAQKIMNWPVYRHWVYAVSCLIAVAGLLVVNMPARVRLGAFCIASAVLLLYLSFLPASVACDFRYLYAGICLVSLLWIVILATARGFANPRDVWRSLVRGSA